MQALSGSVAPKSLRGIFPPLPTPFVNDEIAFDKWKILIEQLSKTDLSGFVVLGSNGETPFITFEEKLELVRVARECIPKEKLLIVGTGLESISETIKLTNEVAKLGADFALVLTPSYYINGMTHEALCSYFTQVADKVTIPVLLYNVPAATNLNIQPKTVQELAKHPNIVGLKNSALDIAALAEYVYLAGKDFSVLVGTASILYAGLCVGCIGGVCALANVVPNEIVQIQKLYEQGDLAGSLALQQKMIAPNRAVTALYGVSGLKAALQMVGYDAGQPRTPLLPATEATKESLRNIFIEAAILK